MVSQTSLGGDNGYGEKCKDFYLGSRTKDFPDGPVVKTLPSSAMRSIPGEGTKVPHVGCSQNSFTKEVESESSDNELKGVLIRSVWSSVLTAARSSN